MAEIATALPPLERPWRTALAMLWRDKLALVAALYLLLVLFAALFGPTLLEDVATKMNLRGRNAPPFTLENGWLYVLGADALGRSILARIVVAAIRYNAPQLKVHEGIVLHSGELSLPSSILKGDENKVHDFLEKHNVPYMVFQYRGLLHLGYLLGRVGSLEGLIIQHAKLTSLSARPQADQDYAKTQQQAVLLPVRALIERGFPTLGAIFNDMETTLAVLEKLISQTRDYMLHKDA